MDRIAIAGISLHDTDVGSLERLARPQPGAESRYLLDLADTLAASELVVLATCNRIEVIYARESGHPPGRPDLAVIAEHLGLAPEDPLRARLSLWTGRDAVRHLFRVTSSLDSVVLGEDQIIAQVRAAFALADQRGLCGQLLRPLFKAAFRVGKQVRSETELARHPLSVASVGLAILRERLAEEHPRIAIIGSGKLSTLAARDARDLGLRVVAIVNRTPESARELAAEVGAEVLALADLARACPPVDAIVSATAAPDTVIDAETLQALAQRRPSAQPLVAVDLALPRDIEAPNSASVELFDLDAVRRTSAANRDLRATAATEAERLVEDKLLRFCERRSQRVIDSTLADLLDESSEVLERELKGLHSGQLTGLDQGQREAVERWARTAFGRLNHVPISAIKRLGADLHQAAPAKGLPQD